VTLFSGSHDFSKVLQNNAPQGNFENLAQAMATLFQLFLGENWQDIMYAAIAVYHSFSVSIYFISFVMIVTIIFTNLFVGLVLSTFNVHYEKHAQVGIANDDLDPLSPNPKKVKKSRRTSSWWEEVKERKKELPRYLSAYQRSRDTSMHNDLKMSIPTVNEELNNMTTDETLERENNQNQAHVQPPMLMKPSTSTMLVANPTLLKGNEGQNVTRTPENAGEHASRRRVKSDPPPSRIRHRHFRGYSDS